MKRILILVTMGLAFIQSSTAMAQGFRDTVGFTQYDLQTTGSTGRRIALDSLGGVHFTWMNGNPYPTQRTIYYNYFDDNHFLWPGIGTPISYRNMDGYSQISTCYRTQVALSYHNARTDAETLFCATGRDPIGGWWDYFRLPDFPTDRVFLWPFVAADRNGKIHIVATATTDANEPMPFAYTRSNDGGATWLTPAIVDTVKTVSPIVVASRVSDKVAIIYTHPIDTTAARSDVIYIESEDGITWNDFQIKHNITDYNNSGDSIRAWAEVSAVYDNNDNLHIIWNAQHVDLPPNPPYMHIADAHLYHYDVSSGTINAFGQSPTSWPDSRCDFGSWNFYFAKFSIAVDDANNLYVAYTSWDSTDCSAGGYANGDIYLSASNDNGATWSYGYNLTNSRSPQCAAGDCESDHWSSLAEVADHALHLFYVNDKDAGAVPASEGMVTDNPLIYREIELPAWGIKDDPGVPKLFTLAQNYPNPFNAKTTIEYSLKENSRISISIYDIMGDRVAVLFDGQQDAGEHRVVWDAEKYSSGIYFARLQSGTFSKSRKIALLK